MKKIVLVVSLILISRICYAETYVIQKPDDTVAIMHTTDSEPIDLTVKKWASSTLNGAQPKKYFKLSEVEHPSMAERRYWKFNGEKIEIDEIKKQADESKKRADSDARDSVLSKLKITKEEAKILNDLGK